MRIENFCKSPENRKQLLTELLDHVNSVILYNNKCASIRDAYICNFLIRKFDVISDRINYENLHILIPELEDGRTNNGSSVWYNDGINTVHDRNILRRNNIIQALNKF